MSHASLDPVTDCTTLLSGLVAAINSSGRGKSKATPFTSTMAMYFTLGWLDSLQKEPTNSASCGKIAPLAELELLDDPLDPLGLELAPLDPELGLLGGLPELRELDDVMAK